MASYRLLEGSVADATVGSGPPFLELYAIAVETTGALVAADGGLQAVVRVDPVSGDRTVVSDATTGSGPLLREPVSIAVEPSGTLILTDAWRAAVVRVDPVSGDRAVVSSDAAGSGPLLAFPLGIAVEVTGTLVVADFELPGVVRIDPVSGDRTILSRTSTGSGIQMVQVEGIALEAAGTLVAADFYGLMVIRVDPISGERSAVTGENWLTGETIGEGLPLGLPNAIAVEAVGTPVVAGRDALCVEFFVCFLVNDRIVRVDPVTGDRTLVSGGRLGRHRGRGPATHQLRGIVVEASGALVVANESPPAVVRIDPDSGNRTMVSSIDTGSGPRLAAPLAIALETSGALVVADGGLQAVVRIDPVSGARAVVSGCPKVRPIPLACAGEVVGSGPLLSYPKAIAVEPTGALVVAVVMRSTRWCASIRSQEIVWLYLAARKLTQKVLIAWGASSATDRLFPPWRRSPWRPAADWW